MLAILNLLAALNSTLFFLMVLRAGIAGWLMMNRCARACTVIETCWLNARPKMRQMIFSGDWSFLDRERRVVVNLDEDSGI